MLMISGHGTISDAVEAVRAGAFDFLEKPLSRDKVLLSLKHALEEIRLARGESEAAGDGRRNADDRRGATAFERVIEHATMAARSDARVLLAGESGTGKELLAAHIHAESPFASGPFVKVNCAAIPTELIESELFGHERVHLRARRRRGAGNSSWPMEGRCFSMKWATCMRLRGQACCASSRKVSSPCGRRAAHPRRGACDRGDESRSDGDGAAAKVSRGFVLPPLRRARASARSARAPRRYSNAGGVLSRRILFAK